MNRETGNADPNGRMEPRTSRYGGRFRLQTGGAPEKRVVVGKVFPDDEDDARGAANDAFLDQLSI